MRRRLTSFFLYTLAVVTAPSGTARADHPTDYKGHFDLTIISEQPVSPTEVFIRGSVQGEEKPLGRFTGEVDYFVDLATGTYIGSVTKKAANDDLLKQTLTGHFTATGGVGDFAIVGGTGRFDGATGGGTFVNTWTNAAMTVGVVTFQGTLSLARESEFHAEGAVSFSNVQGATRRGGIAPYLAIGFGDPIGPHVQFGSILNRTGLLPIDATTLIFYGEVGPNPSLPGSPRVHVIETLQGRIYCTWTAVFTLKIINSRGDAVFSGDGTFTVTGGTGRYRDASGTFETNFQTLPVPAGSNRAIADYQQSGTILRD